MASLSKTALVYVLVITIFYVPSFEGRKILSVEKMKAVPSLEENLVLSGFNKEATSTLSSGKQFDYKLGTNEKLSGMNIAKDFPVLKSSVPSPGIGN
ncbi:hypothetical protein Patl1_04878 [Pistacia atlantica]|uniref:Uncharacterized protein n=1 Tax=Pistacia atlantica TaxID=434234 RepID=A0ACC1BT28_9ROSI|nr:hypothetical protein Patl1_04878 [Pistacia atlantica]